MIWATSFSVKVSAVGSFGSESDGIRFVEVFCWGNLLNLKISYYFLKTWKFCIARNFLF